MRPSLKEQVNNSSQRIVSELLKLWKEGEHAAVRDALGVIRVDIAQEWKAEISALLPDDDQREMFAQYVNPFPRRRA